MYGKLAHLYPIGSAVSRRSASKRYLVHLLYLLVSFSAIISRTLLRTMLLVIHKSSTLEANNALFLPLLTNTADIMFRIVLNMRDVSG